MAILSGVGESYTASGASGVGLQNREDLADFITNISPVDCPFTSTIGKTSASAVIHEWLTHSLAAASATNVAVEGNDATFATPTTLTRVTNVCQINEKTVAISGTQDRVNKAGMGAELAYRVLMHTKEIKRDFETAALQNTVAVTGSTTVARQMNGFEGFVTTNTATLTVALTEALLNATLQDVWTQGGDPDTLMVGGNNKKVISALTTGVTKNLDADKHKLTTVVDVYESDFGMMKVVPNRFDNTQTVKIIQSNLWRTAILRPMAIQPLAKSGDSTKRLLNCEATLECRQEAGNGSVTTL